jgi:hypothetical protein
MQCNSDTYMRFYDQWRRKIGAFYHLDGQWQDADPEERRRRRQVEIGPLLDECKRWCEAHQPKLLPLSPLAKAMGYAPKEVPLGDTLTQWGALTRFLEDGRLPLDNNAAERALRPIDLGRNYVQSGGADPSPQPWKNRESVELATLEWVAWFNNHRLLESSGYVPPAEAEANYYRRLTDNNVEAT